MIKRVKICGITRASQGRAIAQFGATALGFICVSKSPRYIKAEAIAAITSQLPPSIDRIGVFADAELEEIVSVISQGNLTGAQLHGAESSEFCRQLRQKLPGIELIKALKIKTPESLTQAKLYFDCVDTLLLDAYHPQLLGGTGETLDWRSLQSFHPPLPWLLAGGLNPENVARALQLLSPDGIDLSSGVERSPGDKDLDKVARLFATLNP